MTWWPTGWEDCARFSDYLAPIEVLHAARADGATVAIARSDVSELLDGTMFWITASIAALFATVALAWGAISWFETGTRRTTP